MTDNSPNLITDMNRNIQEIQQTSSKMNSLGRAEYKVTEN